MKGKLFIVSAPSGAGKTSLVKALLERVGSVYKVQQVVTYTTRSPREHEQDGIDYHFLAPEVFEQKIQEGFFLEWSSAYVHYYGSARSVLDDLSLGISSILVIDRDGARAVMTQYQQAVSIWITVDSLATLEQRLRARGTDNELQLQHRLQCASNEIAQEKKASLYKYQIINEQFVKAVIDFEKIVLQELEKAL